jgi:hypothetical protein
MVVMKALAAGFDRCVTFPKRVNQAGDSGGRMRIENRESILILIRYPPSSILCPDPASGFLDAL